MITKHDLIDAYARNTQMVKEQTADLDHADSCVQLPFPGNCLNWVVGHMIGSRNTALQQMGREPILTADEAARYGYGSEPVCADGDDVIPLARMLELLDTSQEAVAAALREATDEELAAQLLRHVHGVRRHVHSILYGHP
jgi:hypothetical protein